MTGTLNRSLSAEMEAQCDADVLWVFFLDAGKSGSREVRMNRTQPIPPPPRMQFDNTLGAALLGAFFTCMYVFCILPRFLIPLADCVA